MFKYSMQLFWSDEDQAYVALVPEFRDLSVLAETPEEAAQEAQVAVTLFLDDMAATGEIPPAPQVAPGFSGQIRLRMPRSLHQRLSGRARMEGVSLNTLIISLLAEALGVGEAGMRATGDTRSAKAALPVVGRGGRLPGVDAAESADSSPVR